MESCIISAVWSIFANTSQSVGNNELHRRLVNYQQKHNVAREHLQQTLYTSLLSAVDSLSKALSAEDIFKDISNLEERHQEQQRVSEIFKSIRPKFPQVSALKKPVEILLQDSAHSEVRELLERFKIEQELTALPEALRNRFVADLPDVMLIHFWQKVANDPVLYVPLQLDLNIKTFQVLRNELNRLITSIEELNKQETIISKILDQVSKQSQPHEGALPPVNNASNLNNPQINQLPSTPPHLSFVNREEELRRILADLAPAYHLIDAPAGYGKTALLEELKRRFKERQWLCAYISVQEYRDLPSIAQALATEFNVLFAQDDDAQGIGRKLGDALVQQCGNEFNTHEGGKKGIVLLIDIDKKAWAAMQSTINYLFTDFVPNMEQTLHDFCFGKNKHNRFRVVFAGRYLAGQIDAQIPLRLTILPLSSFDYEVVCETVQRYLPDEEKPEQLTAHLMHHTAGHPGCIARVLKLYKERGVHSSPDDFFNYYYEEILEDNILLESNGIKQDIDQSLRRCLEELSVYRFLNYKVLEEYLDQTLFSEYADAFDLQDALTNTHLMNWDGRFLRDSLTRRLLALHFRREIGSQTFAWHCQRARRICTIHLQIGFTQKPEIWAIEFLFQFLQQHTNQIQSPEKRREIRKYLLEVALLDTLGLLVKNRNPKEEYLALKQALEIDWEFRFTVNYYLREDQYNDDPYNEFLQKIKLFCINHKCVF